MTDLSPAAAQSVIAAALDKAAALGLKPMTITVLDVGGHLTAMARQDGSSIMRPQIAFGKAYGALAVGIGSPWLNANAERRPHFVQALNGASGGVMIRNEFGVVLGAVGVTGDTSDNDAAGAVAGIEAVGHTADVG